MDVLCQAKSGMGKTAVFVLSVLQQIEPAMPAEVGAIVLCHTRELAYQVRFVSSSSVFVSSSSVFNTDHTLDVMLRGPPSYRQYAPDFEY